MGRVFSVRHLLLAAFVCLFCAAGAAAQTADPSSEGSVNLVFTVPVHIELVLSDEEVALGSWTFDATGAVEGGNYGPSMVAQSNALANHLTVHANIPNWTLTQQAQDTGTASFLASGGIIVIRLDSNLVEGSAASYHFTSSILRNTFSTTAGKGTSTFGVVYYAVAPMASQVNPETGYTVRITYTVTADA